MQTAIPANIRDHLQLFSNPFYLIGLIVLIISGVIMLRSPLGSAGSAEEPAPPVAVI